jgi:hypothetical protein
MGKNTSTQNLVKSLTRIEPFVQERQLDSPSKGGADDQRKLREEDESIDDPCGPTTLKYSEKRCAE